MAKKIWFGPLAIIPVCLMGTLWMKMPFVCRVPELTVTLYLLLYWLSIYVKITPFSCKFSETFTLKLSLGCFWSAFCFSRFIIHLNCLLFYCKYHVGVSDSSRIFVMFGDLKLISVGGFFLFQQYSNLNLTFF